MKIKVYVVHLLLPSIYKLHMVLHVTPLVTCMDW